MSADETVEMGALAHLTRPVGQAAIARAEAAFARAHR